MKLYALIDPKGSIVMGTFDIDKRSVWGKSYNYVAEMHEGFGEKYWKKWEPSLRAAKKLGYSIKEIEVKIKE